MRQTGVAATLHTRTREEPSSNLDRDTDTLTEVSYFSSVLQKNAETVPRLGHDRFLPNPFQFIVRPFNAT
jgi:hypothetical protein